MTRGEHMVVHSGMTIVKELLWNLFVSNDSQLPIIESIEPFLA